MSERREIRVPAPRGSHFDPAAARNAIGDTFPLNVEGKPFGTAKCVDAKVAVDGTWIELTLEADRWPDLGAGKQFFSYDIDAMENDPLNEGATFPLKRFPQ